VLYADPAPGVTFTKIADTSTLIPGGQWAGEKFKSFGIPAIDDGNVVFLGVPDSSTNGDNGVYGWKNGALGLVADPSVPHPSGGTLREFREPSIRGDTVAFRTEGGDYSIFRVAGGTVTSIGTIPVTRFRSPSMDGEDTWFYGYSFGPGPLGGVIDGGFYRARGGTFQNVVPHGSPTPSAPAGYTFYFVNTDHRVTAIEGRAVFYAASEKANSPSISGLYSVRDGVVERIVDSTMLAPGGDSNFSSLFRSPFAFDDSTFVFRSGQSIYKQRDGVFEVVATAGEPAPGGGVFAFTDYDYPQISVDGGHLAFTEGPNPIGLPTALHCDLGGSLMRIISRNDILLGETVARVQIGPSALSRNQIVFYAEFMNGNSGVFVATIPEPAAALIGALALFGRVGLRRRDRSKGGS